MPTPNQTFMLMGPEGKPYASALAGTLGGHRGGKLYGRLDCRAALQAIARSGPRGSYVRHRVFFADEATAIAAGYRPCAVCMPQAYSAWKKNQPAKPAGSAQKARRPC